MTEDDDSFNQRLGDAIKRNHLDLDGKPPIAGNNESSSDFAAASAGLATGMRIGLEFMTGTVVGLLIGWGLDSWLGTTPWLLLIFTILGFAAGVMNVYRAVNNIDEGIGINRRNALTKEVESRTSKATD
jgi:ATP synthase protein I